MENNYVYASVQIKQPGSISIRRSPRWPLEPSFTHLRLSFSYKVHHHVIHQPEDPEQPSTLISRSCDAAVKHTAWLGTTAAFNNRPQSIYSKVAAIFTNLGVEEKSHRRLFDNLVVDIRQAAASVLPKLMILPLKVIVVRDHLIFISDKEEGKEKKACCVVDDQKKGSVAAEKKEKVQKSRRRRRRRKYY